MKIGFLFPGQGSQSVGMGKDIYEQFEEVKKIYNKVYEITGIDIKKITFEGPEEELNLTKNTQLAILTMELGILEVLKEKGINADISAGLSLGEYSALIYSGAISLEDGIRIVQKRGEYMQNLVPEGEWMMSAIMGLEDNKVDEICEKTTKGFVVPANYNYKGQVVISGEREAVEEAMEIAKTEGAKRTIPLKTAGPFHTKKLVKASEALKEELKDININKFNSKVVKNIDGKIYGENDDIKEILAKHIISPVKFSKTLEVMKANGVDTYIEIGPGKTLSGFVKKSKMNEDVKILNTSNLESLLDVIGRKYE